MLEILRITSLSLAFFLLGLNLSVIKHHYERPGKWVIVGRIGILLTIIISMVVKLLHQEVPGSYIFHIILIPSLIISTIGLLKFYQEQEYIEHSEDGSEN
jgi:hypothetical protein